MPSLTKKGLLAAPPQAWSQTKPIKMGDALLFCYSEAGWGWSSSISPRGATEEVRWARPHPEPAMR